MRFVNPIVQALAILALSACGAMPDIRFVPKSDSTVDAEQGVDTTDKAANNADEDDSAASQASASQAPASSINRFVSKNLPVSRADKSQFEAALTAIQAKQFDKATMLLQTLIEQSPHLSGPYLNLGLVYRELGQWSEAASILRQAVVVNPDNPEAYNQLGIVLREQGKFEDAEQSYLSALEVWPNDANAHRNLGILYELYIGQFDKAVAHYEQYVALGGSDVGPVNGWIADLKRRM